MGFESKADDAGKALKEKLGLAQKSVKVDGDGREARLPPEGSYARQALDKQAREMEQARSQEMQVQRPPQEAAAAPVRAEQGLSEPQVQTHPADEEDAVSKRARDRIEELARRRREEEQKRLDAEERADTLKVQLDKERAEKNTVQAEFQRFVNEQVESLDPETRAAVMQDAKTRQLLEEQERRILSAVQPALQEIRERELNRELVGLASKYPGYDHEIHAEQVRDFMARNPNSSPEQAFKAIASDEVLYIRPYGQPSDGGKPAFIGPKSTQGGQSFKAPQEKDPDQELRERTVEVHKLARVSDPEAQREHRKAMDDLIRRRLGM